MKWLTSILGLLLFVPLAAENWTPTDTLDLLRKEASARQSTTPLPPAGPMLIWSGVGDAPLASEDIAILLSLGFNQHLPLHGNHLSTARQLHANGAPIQIMEGLKRFHLPNENLPANPTDSFNLATWRKIGDFVRHTLQSYQKAGLPVDFLWLDYEGYPFLAPMPETGAAKQFNLPLHLSEEDWATWRRQFTLNILSSYIAAPAREVFPQIEVLNWTANLSFPDIPLINALGQATPASGPLLFTDSNPYAYGNTLSYELAGLPTDLALGDVDAFYQELLLRHVSTDSHNRQSTPGIGSVPWVGRVVRDSSDKSIPTMRREAYRETLRHLWLRGIQGMLVFNPPSLTAQEHAQEISDVAAIWHEMSPHRLLIESGKTLNLEGRHDLGVLWSGLRSANRAIIRVCPYEHIQKLPDTMELAIWPDTTVTISMPTSAQTYAVWKYESIDRIIITPLEPPNMRYW